MKKKIIEWLIRKYLKGFHLSKNPVRKKGEKGNGE
jgi:hypothetical protein